MSKKLFVSISLALATALTSTAAFADQRQPTMAEALAAKVPIMVADRRGNDVDVLDAQRATGRAGSLTLSAPRGSRDGDLAIVSSDPRLDLGRIVVTYANGRTTMLRGAGNGAIELPGRGRIASIRVSYINRGGRGAIVKLIARDGGRNDGNGDERPGRGGRNDGDDRADRGGRNDGDDRGPGRDGHGHR